MTIQHGHVVIVTGATSGLGRSLSEELVHRGASVLGVGRRAGGGDELRRVLADAPGAFEYHAANLTEVEGCEAAVAAADDAFGRLDGLVNNAGTVGTPPLMEAHLASAEWWDEILDLNLRGLFFMCSRAIRAMLPNGSGHIINIASTSAVAPIARMQAYNTSKAAVVHLSKGLAVEYQSRGIRVNSVILGAVGGGTGAATAAAMTRHTRGSDAQIASPELGQRIGQSSRQTARSIAALFSNDFDTLTGATVELDRGYSAGLLSSLAMYGAVRGDFEIPLADE